MKEDNIQELMHNEIWIAVINFEKLRNIFVWLYKFMYVLIYMLFYSGLR